MSNLASSVAGTLSYYHVDVFCDRRFAGNGLTVFPESQRLSNREMQTITTEMRQFESIFLRHREGDIFDANVFTMQEELDFAGHPSLGAAATLHDLLKPGVDEANWVLAFPRKNIPIRTMRTDYGFEAVMNQGPASFGRALTVEEGDYFLRALGISPDDIMPGFSPQVVSTGLPYLLMPMERNGLRARIGVTDLGERLSQIGAKFIGVLEVPTRSIRTWDVLGLVEDSATGSLAGPAAAWLVQNGFCAVEEPITIRQGENLGRNSRLFGRVEAGGDVYVSGGVVNVASGQLLL